MLIGFNFFWRCFMKQSNWIVGGIAVLLGLLIIIFPTFWVKVVVILLGLGSIAYGIYSFKVTKGLFEDTTYERVLLIKSIVSVVIGILAVVLPLAVANAMWTIMVYILAVYLLVASVLGFYSVSLLKDSGIERKRFVFENLGLLIGAIVLFIIPARNLGTFIIRLIGVAALAIGIVLLLIEFFGNKKSIKAEYTVSEESKDN